MTNFWELLILCMTSMTGWGRHWSSRPGVLSTYREQLHEDPRPVWHGETSQGQGHPHRGKRSNVLARCGSSSLYWTFSPCHFCSTPLLSFVVSDVTRKKEKKTMSFVLIPCYSFSLILMSIILLYLPPAIHPSFFLSFLPCTHFFLSLPGPHFVFPN